MADAIDRFFAAECVKNEVDKVYKEAKEEAEAYYSEEFAKGRQSLYSTVFGVEAGEYKYGRTKPKEVVEFELYDKEDFADWLDGNPLSYAKYILEHAEDFAEWWMNETGELPDGISRTSYVEESKVKPPSIYKKNMNRVKEVLANQGNILEAANRMLLGGQDD